MTNMSILKSCPQQPQVRASGPRWRSILGLVILVLIARLAYLLWLSPYELVGDEAYYWVQSRHLDWSYREKGPLLAWVIAICCRLFGDFAWAVRLPVAIASALAAWGIGRVTLAFTRGDTRAAWLGVVAFLLVPAFVANAQICTQDGLLIALLVALSAVGLRLIRRWELDRNTWCEWLGLWALIGIGLLLKQSVLLFVTAFIPYCIVRHGRLKWRGILLAQQLVGIFLLLMICGPLLYWERRHGWPMLAHTLGHAGLGSDHAAKLGKINRLVWVGTSVGGIIGAAGPAFMVLSVWASIAAIRARRAEPERWPDRLWFMCAAWPSVLFFVALSFVKPVVPSWPLPSLVPLVPLVAELASRYLRTSGGGDENLEPRFAKLVNEFKRWWTILVWYGLGAALVIMFPTVLGHLPVIGKKFEKTVLSRIHGARTEAQAVYAAAMRAPTPDGQRPIVVTRGYQKASLLSFYMPHDALVVTTSSGYVASRPNNFDVWDDTRLTNPSFRGRSLLLVGGTPDEWRQRLDIDSVTYLDAERNLVLATNFQGRRESWRSRSEEAP